MFAAVFCEQKTYLKPHTVVEKFHFVGGLFFEPPYIGETVHRGNNAGLFLGVNPTGHILPYSLCV